MSYKTIDMPAYPRRAHFDYFRSLAYPYVGTTVNVDITALVGRIKRTSLPFFFTVCHCVARAANSVPEFRQRIVDDGIVEFDQCRTSHTVALEDGTFCFCVLEDAPGFADYLREGRAAQAEAKRRSSIQEDPAEALDKLFVTSLPWISYTALVQPVPSPADSNPRISWGRYFVQEGRTLLPVSVLCHHALVDGIHLSAFYQNLDEEIKKIGKT